MVIKIQHKTLIEIHFKIYLPKFLKKCVLVKGLKFMLQFVWVIFFSFLLFLKVGLECHLKCRKIHREEFRLYRIHIPLFDICLVFVIYSYVQDRMCFETIADICICKQLLSEMPDVLSYVVLHRDRTTKHVIKVK